MAGPYDAVVTIGGQSFVDGLWRILGPALERLTNPLPLALPGFSNAQMRIANLAPMFPTGTFGTGLEIVATIQLTAETLMHIAPDAAGTVVSLGPQPINLTSLGGSIQLPDHAGTITDLAFAGSPALGTGVGKIKLAAVDGVLAMGAGITPTSLGLPLPAIVPVALDLTSGTPLHVSVVVPIVAAAPSPETRFSLSFSVGDVHVGGVPPIAADAVAAVTATLQATVDQIVGRLNLPTTIPSPTISPADVTALLDPIPGLVARALDEALSPLFAATGRLIYPKPDHATASCDALALPTVADVKLAATLAHGYSLQLGLSRVAGSGDIAAFPASSGPLECQVLIGNSFVLDLLCCLIERLPTMSLPNPATSGTTDVAGHNHLRCCNFTGVTAAFGPIVVGNGGISVCIDGKPEGAKSFTIVGKFQQTISVAYIGALVPTIATITVNFTLPIAFDLDEVAALTNLRVTNASQAKPNVSVSIVPSAWFTVALIFGIVTFLIGINTGHSSSAGGGFFSDVWDTLTSGLSTLLGGLTGLAIGLIVGPLVAAIVIILVHVACGTASWLLTNAVRMIFSGGSLLKSPVALPPGLFEAFGRLSPASITVDDLTATGVLHTPTSPWAVLPRFGQPSVFDPGSGEVDPRGEA